MAEPFEWRHSKDEYVEYESDNEVGMDALYAVNCPECGDECYNTSFDPDADSPSWLYECHECELYIRARPVKLRATASDMNL